MPHGTTWIAAIQADARAGMVPEGELAKYTADVPDENCGMENVARWVREYKATLTDGSVFDSIGQLVTEGGEVFAIDMEEFEEHEAELAKAWEAGRDAAADHLKWCRDEECCSPQLVRAIQPPGGKAK